MAFWFIENAMDKARQDNALRARLQEQEAAARIAQEKATFMNEMDWSNKMRALDQVRNTAKALGYDPQSGEGAAWQSTFPIASRETIENWMATGPGREGFKEAGKVENTANIAKDKSSTSQSNFWEGFFNARDPQGSAVAQNVEDTARTFKGAGEAEKARGIFPLMHRLGQETGKSGILAEGLNQSTSRNLTSFNRAQEPLMPEIGRQEGVTRYVRGKAAGDEALNRGLEARAFGDRGGPEISAAFNTPPTTFTGLDGKPQPANKWSSVFQDMQIEAARQAQLGKTQEEQRLEQENAVKELSAIINDPKTPAHLLPYFKYARAQAIMGGRLSSLPGLNADIMMMGGGSSFGDINSGNEW